MDFYEAFAHTWGSTGTVDDGLTTTQYDQGWNFIGARPPRLGEFNKREKLIDQRLKWLYDQLKTAADAHGVTLAGADVGGLLAILQDLIGDHTSALDPHAQYQLESGMSAYATLANPDLTGTPTAPTAAAGTNTTQIAPTAFAMTAASNSLPAGSLIYCAGSTVPAGYLEANGALLSRTTYAALFAAIGIIYSAGDGSTTFGLPDLRGEFIRGWDHGRGIDAGRLVGSWQGDSIRNITGTFGGYTANNWDKRSGAFTSDLGTFIGPQVVDNLNEGQNTTTFDASRVVPTANENRPRNVSALICIKY